MPLTLGLAGFGRIGRNLVRLLHRSDDVRIGAIADPADHDALAYLLRYDTILGRFPTDVRLAGGRLVTWGREIPLLEEPDPSRIDWSEHGVDYVVMAVGRPVSRSECEGCLEQGARRVLLCAPPEPGAAVTIVHGTNDARLGPDDRVVSNGSCTAHCAAPVLRTLHDAFGVERAHLSVVHAFTREQRLADVPSDNPRLSRAAAENIVPSATNAASVLEEVLPDMKGSISASSLRVPVPNGSIVDFTLWLGEPADVERVNEVLRSAASGPYHGILEYVEDPIVSSDIATTSYSSTFDALATMSQEPGLLKAIAWFDNGWGYTHRLVDLARQAARQDEVLAEAPARAGGRS